MRDPLLEWFASSERILSIEEQRAIIARVRADPDRMRGRSLMFWIDPVERAAKHAPPCAPVRPRPVLAAHPDRRNPLKSGVHG